MLLGTTVVLPLTGKACESSAGTVGVRLTEVVFVLVQVSVLNWPAVTVVGFALSFTVGAGVGCGGGVLTVMVTLAVADPPAPLAVST